VSRHYPTPVFDDALDAAAAKQAAEEARLAEQRERARTKFRTEFPQVTAFADECRAVFGDGVRVLWAIENGKVVGRPPASELKRYETSEHPLQQLRLTDKDH